MKFRRDNYSNPAYLPGLNRHIRACLLSIGLFCTIGEVFSMPVKVNLESRINVGSKGILVVVNKADHSVTLIELLTQESYMIPVGFAPHEAAASPSGKYAVVTNYGDGQQAGNSLTLIDLLSRKKVKDIMLGEYLRPHGIEFLNDKEVLVTSEVKSALVKINIDNNTVTEIASTAQQGSHMVAYVPGDRFAYVTNVMSGTVSIIDVEEKKLSNVINVAQGIEGIAVTPDRKQIWVANREDSSVIVIDSETKEKLALLPAHKLSFRVKITPDGKYAIVSNALSANLSIYDVAQKKLIRDIDLTDKSRGDQVPVGIAVSNNSEYVFVCSGADSHVIEVSLVDWTIKRRIATGNEPDGIAYAVNLRR